MRTAETQKLFANANSYTSKHYSRSRTGDKMDYITVQAAAEKWGVSPRRVQILCSQDRIPGARRFGNRIMIPANAVYPVSDKNAPAPSELSMPRKTPFLYMSDIYSVPGSAEECIASLDEHPLAKLLFTAEIEYSRGNIDKVYEQASLLLENHSGFYAVISAGMRLALCAIWRGDLEMWRNAKIHIAEAPAENDMDRDIIAFSLTAVDSMLYDVEFFPDWFKTGCFEPLHKDSLPAAKVFYAKFLYAIAYGVATKQHVIDGVQGLTLMSLLPGAIEPMISQAMADDSVIAELYLRMTCATVYHNAGNKEQAIRHLDRAIALALPDRLYGLLAEYYRVLDSMIEQRLSRVSLEAWEEVKRLARIYVDGWSELGSKVRGRTILTTLTPKEREVAKFAAFGMQYAEIAERVHISVSGVKQIIKIVSEKSGLDRKDFAAIL